MILKVVDEELYKRQISPGTNLIVPNEFEENEDGVMAIQLDNTYYSLPLPEYPSDSELRLYMSTLSPSAYVRMSKDNAANDRGRDGSHSFVYISHNSNGVTMYEANRDGKCGVQYHFRNYADIRASYPYGFKDVSHNYATTGINVSTDYHRIRCTSNGCAAYIIQRHVNVATDTGHICKVCGSTTGFGPIIIE